MIQYRKNKLFYQPISDTFYCLQEPPIFQKFCIKFHGSICWSTTTHSSFFQEIYNIFIRETKIPFFDRETSIPRNYIKNSKPLISNLATSFYFTLAILYMSSPVQKISLAQTISAIYFPLWEKFMNMCNSLGLKYNHVIH